MADAIENAFKSALIIFVALVIPGALEWITWKAVGTAVVATFVTSLIGSMTSKGVDTSRGNFGTKFSTRSSTAPRQIIYGQARVGGTISHINTSGTDNTTLNMVVAIAGHEIEELIAIRVHETVLTFDSGQTIGGETGYTATNSKYINAENDNAFTNSSGTANGLFRYALSDGTQTTANGFGVANIPAFGANHKGIGVAYVCMQFIYDAEAYGGGFPNVSFDVKGKKLYDPRKDSTAGGSGTHRLGTLTTYEWSDNPALIALDYLTNTVYGLKALAEEVNMTTNAGGFMAAANTCDQTVTLADNSTTEKRYTTNGFVDMSASGEGVFESVLSSCIGKLTYTSGKFNLFVGAAQTPSMTITDDNLLSPPNIKTSAPDGQLFNSVKSIFVDKNNKYTGSDAPVLEVSSFLTADTPSGESSANFKKMHEVQLPFKVTDTMAQRIQKAALYLSRNVQTMSCLVDIEYLRLQPNDWVYVTNERLGFTNKTFSVESTSLEPYSGGGEGEISSLVCRLNLVEIDAATWNYVYNEYSTPIADDGTGGDEGDNSISAPTGLALAQQYNLEGVTPKIDIKATWTNIANDDINGTEISYKLSTDGSYTGSITVGKGVTSALIPNVVIGKTYNVKVRHSSAGGVYSDYTSAVNLAITDPTSISAPSSFATTNLPMAVKLAWTNPNNTNLRAIKIYRHTASWIPSDDTYLVETVAGEPNAPMVNYQGRFDGLTAGVTYYFAVRAITHEGLHSAFSSVESGSFTFGKDDIGLNNVTNHTQIKDDGSNAPNILKNSQISIGADGALANAGGGQVTTGGIGAETPSGAQTKVDDRLSSTEKTRLNAGSSPDNSLDLNNANVDKAHVGLGNVDNDSTATIRSGTTKDNVGLGNVANVDQRDGGNLNANSVDASTKATAGSIGKIGGISGESSSDNSQDISVTEIVRSIYGDNNYPFHLAGATASSTNPSVSIGDYVGQQNSLGALFSFTFTTHNWGAGTKDFIILTSLDYSGSVTSSSESIFATAMKATSNATDYTSTTRSDYIFTRRTSGSGTFSIAGQKTIYEKVSLSANTQYYIWCFGIADDGVSSYSDGTILVQGLNK